MAHYYYIGTLLPELSLEAPSEYSFYELQELLRDELSAADYQKTRALKEYFDLLNLRSLWKGESLDLRGDKSAAELQEAVASGVGLPSRVYEFMDRYPKIEERVGHFSELIADFFQRACRHSDPFLRRYFIFERTTRLILTAWRAHGLRKNLEEELKDENPEDPLVAELLSQKEAPSFVFPEGYEDLSVVIQSFSKDPVQLQKELDRYAFDRIGVWSAQYDPFSIERILAYLIQWNIIEKWFSSDDGKGKQLIEELIKIPLVNKSSDFPSEKYAI